MNDTPILDRISSPEDLRQIQDKEIPPLAAEIRKYLIDTVMKTGGHLASNLGVVELTLALHRVFDTPNDRLIFDVGHQSYVHKLLTGRRDRFDLLRTPGGLSGFTRREESKFDPFGAGPSSTSVSAALGFARADRLQGKDSFTVAVIGDGAFTGGMVHEALNNCSKDLKLVIVLNENEMSISRNIGAFARHIAKIRTSRRYRRAKRDTQSFLRHIPLIGKGIYHAVRGIKKGLKNLLYSSNYFEELGLYYIGPVDGNDYNAVKRALIAAKEQGEPALVHVRTVKGKGYPEAEADPRSFHSIHSGSNGVRTFGDAFGEWLTEEGERDPRVVAVTAAMGVATGLEPFAARFPDRYTDVGIAEEHAMTYSAGLAAGGLVPYVTVYSTFLQRAYDNLLHDVALQGLPVRIMIDRAGLAKSDGPTHHGIFDVAFLSHIPGVRLFAPVTYGSLSAVLEKTKDVPAPVAIRYPNSGEDSAVVSTFYPDGVYGEPFVRSDGIKNSAAVIVTYGGIVPEVLKAKERLAERGITVSVILLEELKPYDDVARKLAAILPSGVPVVFVEEGIYDGGASMILSERLREIGQPLPPISISAIRDQFASPNEPCDLLGSLGLDAPGIADAVLALLQK
ncbi:MAG: 1-deoxy-D-xylulose-5-phosphate synthase [Clostridia bacterium]|nr:1-deoxy-D-xylulose-5-phosphate synthase [Clostridia bacterium]